MVQKNCTHCGEPFSIQAEDQDGFAECPHCNQTNVLKQNTKSEGEFSEADSTNNQSEQSDSSIAAPEEHISTPSTSKTEAEEDKSSSNQQKEHAPEPDQPRRDVSSWGIVSLIFGILSLPASCLFCILGFIPGAVAIGTGWMGIHKTSKEENMDSGRILSIAGLLTGIIGVLFSLAWIGLFVFGIITGETKTEEIDMEVPEEEQRQMPKKPIKQSTTPAPVRERISGG